MQEPHLVDSKCLEALRLVPGAEQAAIALAKQAKEMHAHSNKLTLEFLGKDDTCDGEFLATLTIEVSRP